MSGTRAFRLGDIRGIYPDEVNEEFVNSFAHALVGQYGLKGAIATGRDVRESSESLQTCLNESLSGIGIEVLDMGVCPTELGYFASGDHRVNAAIVITASHNPANYNGLKCVLSNGQAISRENGLAAVEKKVSGGYRHPSAAGSIEKVDFHSRYLEFLKARFPADGLATGKLALNGMNGTAVTMAGAVADALDIPVAWFKKGPGPVLREGADPTNPSLAREMKSMMAGEAFTLGVAWDGDCDRCVCFDSEGELIPPYYLIGFLVEHFLQQSPGGAVVFDTKLCWNTLEMIEKNGGRAVPARTGHIYMKKKMQESAAVYGGELSSHHYFGDFHGCDAGMLAWLTVLKMLKSSATPIHEMVAECRELVCCTPEISLAIEQEPAFLRLEEAYGDHVMIREDDGLAFELPGNWRFSVRPSKTEPLARFNFEGRNPEILLEEGRKVLELMEPFLAAEQEWRANWRIQ